MLNEYIEEELSIKDIEKRFSSLKKDLQEQLDKNEELLNQEIEKKKRKK